MSNLSVRAKLFVLALVALLLLLAMWAGMYFMAQRFHQSQEEISSQLERNAALSDATAAIQQLNTPGNDVLEDWDYGGERQNLINYRDEYEEQERHLAKLAEDAPDLQRTLSLLKPDVRTMVGQAEQVITHAEHKVL